MWMQHFVHGIIFTTIIYSSAYSRHDWWYDFIHLTLSHIQHRLHFVSIDSLRRIFNLKIICSHVTVSFITFVNTSYVDHLPQASLTSRHELWVLTEQIRLKKMEVDKIQLLSRMTGLTMSWVQWFSGTVLRSSCFSLLRGDGWCCLIMWYRALVEAITFSSFFWSTSGWLCSPKDVWLKKDNMSSSAAVFLILICLV